MTCYECSMIPYGAICTKCHQIQTSRAIALATPPAAAWPVIDRLGDWTGTKKSEEELLQNLDMELFELINVPHELDEWGRRVYNDCGHRILYYQDSDGNTVMGYEAWYPCSVTGEYEEPDDWRTGRQNRDSAVDKDAQYPEYDDCGRRTLCSAEPEGDTVTGGYEACYPNSVPDEYEEPENWRTGTQAYVPMIDFEQQRLAEFLAAQEEELPQFQSDRERIAAWIATSSVADDEDVSVLDCETKETVFQWYTGLEDFEPASPSQVGVPSCSDGTPEKGYVSVPLCAQ
ncbi:hypothetical protein HO133_006586 [Letharia lupina]|uniref:Uncharacterized protein n=1 Tax=Letharia lupina TaxID=560253 RepID=A0A8H6F7Q4_9LECA|nr:uncharacterized protein HO133_006586 [Letharia lupina]KAF6217759.1 hypothetical protein HO133_006586 [Letharia lupina]